MKRLIRAAALILALQPAVALAQIPGFPQTLPANTVIGRLGIGAGPAQAIPFANFNASLLGNAFVQFTGPTSPAKTYTLANASGTLAQLNQIETWTGAQSFTDGTLILLGLTSGSSTIKAPATGGGVATLFPGADTIAGIAATQALTNKTFNCASNTCTVRIANDVTGLGTGVATALGVNVGSAGAFVTFNGALGTPSSGTLTSATGLPISSGVSGLGTGIATALGVNVGTAGSPVINGGALGTPASGTVTNLTGTASGLTAGTVTTNANLTGPVTSTGNATAIANNQITRAMEAQGVARSVIGVAGNATANVADIQGTAGQVLAVNAAGTALAFVGPGQTPAEPSTGSATAGNVGEYIESSILLGSATALTTATPKTVTSITLTAGDWDVDCVVNYNPVASTSITALFASVSLATNALDLTVGRFTGGTMAAVVPGTVNYGYPVPPLRFSVSTNTSVFMVAQATFTVSTLSAYGIIRARRVR